MYIRQVIDCQGIPRPEYGCEPEEFLEVDDLDLFPINLNELNLQEF